MVSNEHPVCFKLRYIPRWKLQVSYLQRRSLLYSKRSLRYQMAVMSLVQPTVATPEQEWFWSCPKPSEPFEVMNWLGRCPPTLCDDGAACVFLKPQFPLSILLNRGVPKAYAKVVQRLQVVVATVSSAAMYRADALMSSSCLLYTSPSPRDNR